MTQQDPIAAKKQMLLEVFKQFASAEIDRNELLFFAAAQNGIQNGMTLEDVQWLQDLSTNVESFKKAYGEGALPTDLTDRMKKHDERLVQIGVPPRFPGFYPV